MPKTATKKTKAVKAKNPKAPRGPRSGPSRRSQQRLIALRMGLESSTISSEELREACRKAGVYNAPNFKQDMKKEAVLFNPVAKNGKTVGWKLTPTGRKIAKAKDLPEVQKAPKKAKAEKLIAQPV